ncbi:ABC transporter permease [Brachybacterium sp. EF45031]|nr:ABC transporter permease [Brachybacterium sillae]
MLADGLPAGEMVRPSSEEVAAELGRLHAVTIGTAFLAASFLVGSTSRAALRDMLGAGMSRADLVVQAAAEQGTVDSGGAPARALYTSVINAILLVVVALLAVSVMIALIGVANTRSVSVIERTRENSLLRALGLTTGGLRTMIALEAILISTVAAALGCALGVFYGWAGSQLLLSEVIAGTASVVVPWFPILEVLAVAAIAGLLASLAPTRRATRLSPVEGLSTT